MKCFTENFGRCFAHLQELQNKEKSENVKLTAAHQYHSAMTGQEEAHPGSKSPLTAAGSAETGSSHHLSRFSAVQGNHKIVPDSSGLGEPGSTSH